MDIETTFHFLPPIPPSQVALCGAVALALFFLIRAFFGPPLALARKRTLWVLRGLILAGLLTILANPVRVDRSPGDLQRSHVFYLLDTSASMALGEGTSRFDAAVETIRDVDQLLSPERRPDLQVYRFGQQLEALGAAPLPATDPIAPSNPDTQLLSALRQLTGRFGGAQSPQVILLSDGRSREPVGVLEMACRYRDLNVPIHVVPLGELDRGGDVAVVNMVVPDRVRKYSQVGVTVWVRSYGYDGVRTELLLKEPGRSGQDVQPLARLPVTLNSGIQAFHLTFQSDLKTTSVEASVPVRSDEVSPHNNSVVADVFVDRTAIRVLYIEGGEQIQPRAGGNAKVKRDMSVQHALSEDPDIECVTLSAPSRASVSQGVRGFPETRGRLFAFDAIIFSNVSRGLFTDRQLAQIDEWVRQRGGGVIMIGGPNSFGDGNWANSIIGNILPVAFPADTQTWTRHGQLTVRPEPDAMHHAIWNMVTDARRNQTILASLPVFTAYQQGLSAKTSAHVLAAGRIDGATDKLPVVVSGPCGKGRTVAVAVNSSPQWSREFVSGWGENDNRYFAKFWRNVVYWTMENSYFGRRRLVVSADKSSFQPGESIKLTARACDETFHPTTDFRVTAIVEPQSLDRDLASDFAPVRWPDGVERFSGETSPYVGWGEELELHANPGEKTYTLDLPLAERLSGGVGAEALRVELGAYEDHTLIDSTSIGIQALDDPFEHRNPLPDVDLLHSVANASNGRIINDANSLAAMLRDLPVQVGPERISKTPLWSRWWLLGLLLAFLSIEWFWRRSIGLA